MSGSSDHNQGEKDYAECGGQVNSNPLTELFHPSYDPPSDPEGAEQYKQGWENAKSQDK